MDFVGNGSAATCMYLPVCIVERFHKSTVMDAHDYVQHVGPVRGLPGQNAKEENVEGSVLANTGASVSADSEVACAGAAARERALVSTVARCILSKLPRELEEVCPETWFVDLRQRLRAAAESCTGCAAPSKDEVLYLTHNFQKMYAWLRGLGESVRTDIAALFCDAPKRLYVAASLVWGVASPRNLELIRTYHEAVAQRKGGGDAAHCGFMMSTEAKNAAERLQASALCSFEELRLLLNANERLFDPDALWYCRKTNRFALNASANAGESNAMRLLTDRLAERYLYEQYNSMVALSSVLQQRVVSLLSKLDCVCSALDSLLAVYEKTDPLRSVSPSESPAALPARAASS